MVKLSKKNVKLTEIVGNVHILRKQGVVYKFCGNRGEYAICIISLEGWPPLRRSTADAMDVL